MGLGESKNAEMLRFVERQWENVRDENGVRVVRNREDDVEAEIVGIIVEPQRSLEKEFEIYEYRRTQEDALVSVFAVQNSRNNDTTFCGNTQMLKVVVERIVSRLKDLPQLQLPASLYVLSEAIRGYSVCFKMIGHFQITSRMIGVNGRGHVKVWLNENFAQNHPVDQRPFLYMTSHSQAKEKGNKEELLMLQELLGVVEEKCENGRFPEQFRGRIYGKANFIDAYNEIEAYSRDRAIEVPACIDVGRLSSSQTKSKTSLLPSLPFISSQYEPRQTLIKNLAFSQSNQRYLESPVLSKQESYNRASSLPAWQPPMQQIMQPSRFFPSESMSSRLPSSQITFNYSKPGFSLGSGQSRF